MADKSRNVRNAASPLFRSLTRLFSGPIVKRRAQFPRAEARRKLDKYKFTSAHGQHFKKSEHNPFANLASQVMANQNRGQRYADFDQMEYDPILASALDLYADEMTTHTSLHPILKINCPNEEIKSVLESLYYEILNVEFNLFSWVRSMCKYGDFFLYLDIDERLGIRNAIGLPVIEVERLEGEDKTNPNYIQYLWQSGGLTFENWQLCHFRILGQDRYSPYGMSIFEPARRIWRQLILLEDSMMAYRITRCLRGDSKIRTEFGYKQIKDINNGEMVYTYSPKDQTTSLTRVIEKINNGKQQIWNIKSLHRSVNTNSTHPILVHDKKTGIVDYVLTKDLILKRHQFVMPQNESKSAIRVPIKLREEKYQWFGFINESGVSRFKNNIYNKSKRSLFFELGEETNVKWDRIKQMFYHKPNKIKGIEFSQAETVCEVLNIPKNYLIKYPKGMKSITRVEIPEYVDEEFARFFGFMVGDGFMRKDLHSIGFATGVRPERNQYYMNILQKYCGQVSFHKDNRTKNSNLGRVIANNFYFAHLMRDMGFTSSVYTKTVPSWIFQCSNTIKEAFVDGLADADGHRRKMRKTESIEFNLCNKNILDGVKELCHQLGWNVSAKVSKAIVADGRKIGKFTIPKTTRYGLYLTKVATPQYENIVSVEKTDEYEDVYDICVESENHNFISDGVVVHNSAERRVFYIDVGNISPTDVEQYVQKVMTNMKRHQITDPTTGKVDLRYNPLSVEHDYFLPVRGNASNTRIETLPGAQHINDIDDVKYLQDKMFAAIKVPQAYLIRGEGSEEDKTTLAQKDIRFARTIQRLQRSAISELEKAGMIHLYTLGFRGDDLISFDLSLHNPSKLAELQELEHMSTQFDVANAASEGYFSRRWISRNVFGLSDDEFERNQREMFYDAKHDASIESVAEQEAIEGGLGADGGLGAFDSEEMGMGDMGGLGGDEGVGGDLGDELSAEDEDLSLEEPTGEDVADDDSALLAAPAKRDDGSYLTKGAKGKWYTPVSQTGGDRRTAGARKRSDKGKYSHETSQNTKRNVFKGLSNLMNEDNNKTDFENTIYMEEEELFNRNYEVDVLLDSLEKMDLKNTNQEQSELPKNEKEKIESQ